LGLFDSTMLVAGSMIGTRIFIVSAEMAREIGSPGWLLVSRIITGVLWVAVAFVTALRFCRRMTQQSITCYRQPESQKLPKQSPPSLAPVVAGGMGCYQQLSFRGS